VPEAGFAHGGQVRPDFGLVKLCQGGVEPIPSQRTELATGLEVRHSRAMDRDEILHVLRAFEEEGIGVWVATPSALYRLKKATVRPLDRQDAEALKQQFDLEEE
jgi:hypothetical protein